MHYFGPSNLYPSWWSSLANDCMTYPASCCGTDESYRCGRQTRSIKHRVHTQKTQYIKLFFKMCLTVNFSVNKSLKTELQKIILYSCEMCKTRLLHSIYESY